jgi:molybdopterin converting factor small subunit
MSSSPHDITVLYFAGASTAAGRTSERIPLPEGQPLALSALGKLVGERYESNGMLKVLASSQWSVDAQMVDDPETTMLKGGEEVAVICPVSGG